MMRSIVIENQFDTPAFLHAGDFFHTCFYFFEKKLKKIKKNFTIFRNKNSTNRSVLINFEQGKTFKKEFF